MCTCVRVCVCMCVCVCMHVCVCVACECVCMCVCACVCVCLCVCVYVCVLVCAYVCVYGYTHVCMLVFACTYVFVWTYETINILSVACGFLRYVILHNHTLTTYGMPWIREAAGFYCRWNCYKHVPQVTFGNKHSISRKDSRNETNQGCRRFFNRGCVPLGSRGNPVTIPLSRFNKTKQHSPRPRMEKSHCWPRTADM